MKAERKFKIELSEKEKELIEAIRNLRSAFPHGYQQLLYFAQGLFDELTDLPEDS